MTPPPNDSLAPAVDVDGSALPVTIEWRPAAVLCTEWLKAPAVTGVAIARSVMRSRAPAQSP